MLKNLWSWVKGLFWVETEQESVEPEIPHYNLPEEWPFPGWERPDQMAVHLLYQGLRSEGDHIFCGEDHKRSIKTEAGQWPVKVLVWWTSGNPVDPGAGSVRSTCGRGSCCRPDHLKVEYGGVKAPKQEHPEVVFQRVTTPKSSETPVRDQKEQKPKADYSLLQGDRSICVSAKVHFPTQLEAARAKNEFNIKIRKPGGRRLYIYDCDWCSGWHLTKQNPKTRREYKHPGSWVS